MSLDLPPLPANLPTIGLPPRETKHWVDLSPAFLLGLFQSGQAVTFCVKTGLPAGCAVVGAAWVQQNSHVRVYLDVGQHPIPEGLVRVEVTALLPFWKAQP